MKRLLAIVTALAITALLLVVVGCGSSSTTTTTQPGGTSTTPGRSSEVDVLGSWQVPGQSAAQYSLTFYPDNTYKMTFQGETSEGTYSTGSTGITLTPSGWAKLQLKGLKGSGGMKDQLVQPGVVTWTRV